MIRLYVDQSLSPGARVRLEAEQGRYLRTVMRRGVGDGVLLFNGRDGEWRSTVAEVGKRGVTLAVVERTRAQVAGPDLELIVAAVKKARLETVVEKAAELGVARVRLCVTRRTNLEHLRMERLRAIAVEASEQTGRLDVPEIVEPERLERMLDDWDDGRRLMFCDEAGDDPEAAWGGEHGRAAPALTALAGRATSTPAVTDKRRGSEALGGASSAIDAGLPARATRTAATLSDPVLATLPKGRAPGADSAAAALSRLPTPPPPWAVLIGPEGGFAPEERARLRALPFATAVALGPRILRADTAAIAALTLWQAALGDWR